MGASMLKSSGRVAPPVRRGSRAAPRRPRADRCAGRAARLRAKRAPLRASLLALPDLPDGRALPQVSTAVRVAVAGAAGNALLAAPAFAEAGKIFDFNLTLPLMAGQFLLLMVFLDKAWFSPVGALLDERDQSLRGKLALVKDNTSDVKKLQVRAAGSRGGHPQWQGVCDCWARRL
jgi:F-type H+-transporting ATPase subunit b